MQLPQSAVDLTSLAVQHSADMLCVHDADGTYRYVNPTVTPLLGYAPDDLLGTNPYDYFHPEDMERIRAEGHQSALEDLPQAAVSYRFRHAEGHYVWLETTTRVVQGAEGTQLVTSSRNVETRADEVLRLARYQSIVMGSRDLISFVNRDYVYQTVNDQYLAYWGKTRADIVGQSVPQLMGAETFAATVQTKLESCLSGAMIQYRAWFNFPQWGRRYMDVLYYPARDGTRRIVGAVVHARDVTNLHRTEQQLEQLFRLSQDMHCVASFDGYFQQLNPAWEATLGWTERELTAHPFIEFVHPDDVEATQAAVGALDADGRLPNFVNRYRCKDGSYRTLSWDSTADPEHGLIYATARDVTALRRMQTSLRQRNAELETVNEQLEQFAYIASHDLQEPLRMVTSYLQLLEKRYKEALDARAQQYIFYAVDGATRMKALINDLLAYSRVGSHELSFEPVNLMMVVADVVINLELAIRESNALIHVGELPPIVADRGQMVQLFQNLMSNAIKFRGERQPEIHIDSALSGDAVTITIADNGIGIDPSYFKQIFVVFQRLHSRAEFEGTGIGLALCKRIIEQHGGTIAVASQVGAGTQFTITLPLDATQESHNG